MTLRVRDEDAAGAAVLGRAAVRPATSVQSPPGVVALAAVSAVEAAAGWDLAEIGDGGYV